MHLLEQRGARMSYSDPHAPRLQARDWAGRHEMSSVDLTREELARHDIVVILTDHRAFDYPMIADASPLVLDTRNALGPRIGPNVFRIGAPQQPFTMTPEVVG
jgi:UDP-N-acetyl-D-glucosamine dehydrogenase